MHPHPTYTQARHIINKFGGTSAVAKILNITRNAVYRWTIPRHKGGTDGLVPTKSLQTLIDASRAEGVLLSEEDLAIRKQVVRRQPAKED